MAEAFNEQLNKEMYSAYLYMSMSAQCNELALKGFANWFMVQFHEEMLHAMKIYEHVQRRGAHVELRAIEAPPTTFDSLLGMFEATLAHEQFISKSINELMDLAIAEKDHASQLFLGWYVTEQVEEEENDNDLIAQLKSIDGNPQGQIMLDRELALRMVAVPTDFSKGVEAAIAAAVGA